MVTSTARIGTPPMVGATLAVATAFVGASLLRFGVGPEAILAGVAAFAFFYVIALVYPGGLGLGDVKLAALLGVGLGAAVLPAFVIGMTAAALYGIALLLLHGAKARKVTIAYGPFLGFGAMVALLVF